MRTTVTLDDDVAAKLKTLVKREGIPFKEAVNAILRRGFAAQESTRVGRAGPVRLEVFDSPFRAGVDPLKLNQLSDELEVDDAVTERER